MLELAGTKGLRYTIRPLPYLQANLAAMLLLFLRCSQFRPKDFYHSKNSSQRFMLIGHRVSWVWYEVLTMAVCRHSAASSPYQRGTMSWEDWVFIASGNHICPLSWAHPWEKAQVGYQGSCIPGITNKNHWGAQDPWWTASFDIRHLCPLHTIVFFIPLDRLESYELYFHLFSIYISFTHSI